MADPTILTFDLGTQSMRAMVVNRQGEILYYAQYKYPKPYVSIQPGYADVDPMMYYRTMRILMDQLYKQDTHCLQDCTGVTLACIRDTIILLDENKKPIRDAILWLDHRLAEDTSRIPGWVLKASSVVHMRKILEQQYCASHINWLIENEKDSYARCTKVVFLPSFLHYLLTGNLVDTPSNMIGHLPFDYKRQTWQKDRDIKRYMCDIPREKLVDLVTESVLGTITEQASLETGIPEGLPLVATGSDKGCETLGVSAIHPYQASLSFGTTATIQFTLNKYVTPEKFLPSYPSVLDGYYNPEIEIFRGYWLISWFKKEFAAKEVQLAQEMGIAPEDLLNEQFKNIPCGSEGLILQPFWTPGVINPDAKGSMIGFHDAHTRIHLYRAIIEGIGYALYDGMIHMQERTGVPIEEVFVSGGGSQSDEICQITADIFGVKVIRIQTHEATGIGASIAGFTKLGFFQSYQEAISSMVHIKDSFTPDMENHRIYHDLYTQIYRKIYPSLVPLYRKLSNLVKRRER